MRWTGRELFPSYERSSSINMEVMPPICDMRQACMRYLTPDLVGWVVGKPAVAGNADTRLVGENCPCWLLTVEIMFCVEVLQCVVIPSDAEVSVTEGDLCRSKYETVIVFERRLMS